MSIKESVFNLVLRAKNLLSGDTKAASDDLGGLTDAVKKYSKQVSDIKSAKKLADQIGELELQSEAAVQSVSDLAAAYQESESGFRAAGDAVGALERDYDQARAGVDGLAQSVSDYKSELSNLNSARSLTQQIENLGSKSAAAANRVAQLQGKYEESLVGFNRADAALKALGDSADLSSKEYQKAAKAQEKWASQVQSSADKLRSAEQKQTGFNTKLADSRIELQALKSVSGIAANSLSELDTEISKSTQSLKQSKTALANQKAEVKQHKQALSEGNAELRLATRELNINAKALTNAEQQQGKLSDKLAKSRSRLLQFKEAGAVAADSVDGLDAELKQANSRLDEARQKLARNRTELRGTADDADRAGRSFAGLAGSVAKITAITGAVGGVIAGWQIGDKFVQGTKSAISFEQQMANVAAVSNLTANELERLTSVANQYGNSTSYTATQAGEALEALIRSGYDAEQAIAILPVVLNTATVAKVGLAEAASMVSDALTIFKKDAGQASDTMDVLTKGAALANTNIVQISEALSHTGSSARDAGYTLEQTVAMINLLAANAIRGSEAGTALKNILAQLGDPGSKAREELAALGIETGDLARVLIGLKSAGKEGEDAIRAFGLEAGPALRALISGGADELKRLETELNNSAGASEKAADRMSQTTNKALDGLKSAFDGARRKLAEPLLEVITEQAKRLTTSLQELTESGKLEPLAESIARNAKRIGDALYTAYTQIDFVWVANKVDQFTEALMASVGFVKRWSTEIAVAVAALAGLRFVQIIKDLFSFGRGMDSAAVSAGGFAGSLGSLGNVLSGVGGRLGGFLSVLARVLALIPITIAVAGVAGLVAAGKKLVEFAASHSDAAKAAERSQQRMKDTAMQYAKDAEAKIIANEKYAQTELKTAEQLAGMTEQELAEYQKRLVGMEQYYRAKKLQFTALKQLGIEDQFELDGGQISGELNKITQASQALEKAQKNTAQSSEQLGYVAYDMAGQFLGAAESFQDLADRFPEADIRLMETGKNLTAVKVSAQQMADEFSDISLEINTAKSLQELETLKQRLDQALGEGKITPIQYSMNMAAVRSQIAQIQQEAEQPIEVPVEVAEVRVDPVAIEPIRVSVEVDQVRVDPVSVEPIAVPVEVDEVRVDPVAIEPIRVPVEVDQVQIDPISVEPIAVPVEAEQVQVDPVSVDPITVPVNAGEIDLPDQLPAISAPVELQLDQQATSQQTQTVAEGYQAAMSQADQQVSHLRSESIKQHGQAVTGVADAYAGSMVQAEQTVRQSQSNTVQAGVNGVSAIAAQYERTMLQASQNVANAQEQMLTNLQQRLQAMQSTMGTSSDIAAEAAKRGA